MKIDIDKLNPHPYNRRIYGYDDNTELIEKIKSSGWIKPILITKGNMIISGHRRVECCKILGIKEIEYEFVDDDPVKQLELFVSENFYRVKTTTQLMKESEIYFDIEKKKSYQRMMSGVNPETGTTSGRTTEIVSKKIGMGETSFKKGRKVMDFVKDNPDWEWIFQETLDQSIDGSIKLMEKPPEFINKVIETVSGNTERILPVIRELERGERESNISLPPGKFGIILMDFTNKHTNNLLLTDISSICEDDCILLMWVRPHQVNIGLDINKHWGFKYSTCFLWDKEKHTDITLNGELLLVSMKGRPTNIFKMYDGSQNKPIRIEELIKRGYPNQSRVEILLGEGWKIW